MVEEPRSEKASTSEATPSGRRSSDIFLHFAVILVSAVLLAVFVTYSLTVTITERRFKLII